MTRSKGRLLVMFIFTVVIALGSFIGAKLFQWVTGTEIDLEYVMILELIVYIELLVYFYVADHFLE